MVAGPSATAQELVGVTVLTQAPCMRAMVGMRLLPATSQGHASRRHEALAALGFTLEKQRLARDGRYGRGLERLGDQECWFGPLAGEKALRESGDEYYRHLEGAQQFIDGIEPGAAIGKLDVRQNQPRLLILHQVDRLCVSTGDAHDPMAEVFNQPFELH